ncbi:hypothetical protein BO71DRAFT_72748 [Aspergillus ellipticus CBS 707.79]|uniref:Uncharacterized protein n=1 Tax=Aspergillus ellipticus CBS 707.79 TaxID=1448320 RepID=A0A319DHH4_9EURO|nr:hypothetical protein BO71DRAFT_72748 [Aspergillus ellipticus CBS 707.79]
MSLCLSTIFHFNCITSSWPCFNCTMISFGMASCFLRLTVKPYLIIRSVVMLTLRFTVSCEMAVGEGQQFPVYSPPCL